MIAPAGLSRYVSFLLMEIKRVVYIMQTKQERNRAFLLVGHVQEPRPTPRT